MSFFDQGQAGDDASLTVGRTDEQLRRLLDPFGRAESNDLFGFLESLTKDEGSRRAWEAEIARSLTVPALIKPTTPVIDLFCGCGGLSLGFEIAGFEVLGGLDSWEPALDTYSSNFNHPAIASDLGDVDLTLSIAENLAKRAGVKPGIIGGPPCQDFSTAGKRLDSSRADLTISFAQSVIRFGAPFFVMENVPNATKSRVYQAALKLLENAGYSVETIVLNAAEHGVPQRRRRLFAVGTRSSHGTKQVMNELGKLESPRHLNVKDWFGAGNIPEYYYRHPRSYQRRGIFSSSFPSPTIRGVNRPMPPVYQNHPGNPVPPDFPGVRALSATERAQIQSFPEGFQLKGSRSAVEQMVGNAVPVRLASFVARSIATGLEDWDG